MALTEITTEKVTLSRRLRTVAERFADNEQLPCMLAGASIIQAYKLTVQRAEAVLDSLDLTMSRYEILGLLVGATGP
jgi:hypothetical protein